MSIKNGLQSDNADCSFFVDFQKFNPPQKIIEFTKNAPWGITKKVAF